MTTILNKQVKFPRNFTREIVQLLFDNGIYWCGKENTFRRAMQYADSAYSEKEYVYIHFSYSGEFYFGYGDSDDGEEITLNQVIDVLKG